MIQFECSTIELYPKMWHEMCLMYVDHVIGCICSSTASFIRQRTVEELYQRRGPACLVRIVIVDHSILELGGISAERILRQLCGRARCGESSCSHMWHGMAQL